MITDSRLVRKGDLFIAFQGDRYDGHAFVTKALAQGAVCAIVQEDYRFPPSPKRWQAPVLLGVRDTLEAYQRLATHYRNRFPIPVIAITGSNGKTTTKEMVAQVCRATLEDAQDRRQSQQSHRCPADALSARAAPPGGCHRNGRGSEGQTSRLCEIARPTIGVITNIGPDHLEFFGSMEGSAQAKAELLDHLPPDGAVVLNADDRIFRLPRRAGRNAASWHSVVSPKADVRAVNIRTDEQGRDGFWPGVAWEKSHSPKCVIRTQGCTT